MNYRAKRLPNYRRLNGFALPTVLIASIIMLSVLMVSVSSTAAIRVAIKTQYYNQLSKNAEEAGIAYAKACIQSNGGTWTTALWDDSAGRSLSQDTGCAGALLNDCAYAPIDRPSKCWVVKTDNIRTSFSVAKPNIDSDGNVTNIVSVGKVELLKTSDESVWKEYSQSTQLSRLSSVIKWRQISSGSNYTCSVNYENNIYCWGVNVNSVGRGGTLGNNTLIDSFIPSAVYTEGALLNEKIVSVSSGTEHTCAISFSQKLFCWGLNGYSQLGDGTTIRQIAPVAVFNNSGLVDNKTVKSVSVGSFSTCAISSEDKAYCWGFNNNGQLGTGNTNNSALPVFVSGDGLINSQKVKMISLSPGTNSSFTCAINADNKPFCWGFGTNGQLGNGSSTTSYSPVPVSTGEMPAGGTVKAISTGESHSCVIASDDKPYCWGLNIDGQLGVANNDPKNVPTAVMGLPGNGTVKMISAGNNHTCAIAFNNNVYCWGLNTNGQLGDSTTLPKYMPTASVGGALNNKMIISVSAGGYHTCAMDSFGIDYCWGLNDNGQLGDGTLTSKLTSSTVTTISPKAFSSIAIGGGSNHICGTIIADTPTESYCWGAGANGVLGNGNTLESSIPVLVSDLIGDHLKSISSNGYHSCGISVADKLYCWGINTNGGLGDNTLVSKSVPTPVYNSSAPATPGLIFGKTIKSVSVGHYFTCAITSDNLSYCWGSNSDGQLGNTIDDTSIPANVYVGGGSALSGKLVDSISAGNNHVCVVAYPTTDSTDKKAYCWGSNSNGQFGNGSTGISPYAVAVNTSASSALMGKTIKSVSVGSSHSCAVDINGVAYCWGLNTNGQLGDGTVNQRLYPVLVNTGINSALQDKIVTSITTGDNHTCAIAYANGDFPSDTATYCWGLNTNGQLGDGTADPQKNYPTAVNTSGALNGKTIKSITASGNITCAILIDNVASCWGSNISNVIGTTIGPFSNIPVNMFNVSLTFYSEFIY